MDLIYRWL